jgi:hypothetical protein
MIVNEGTMADLDALWKRAAAAIGRVREAGGQNPNYETLRADPAYMDYTGLCGDAQMAYDMGDLDDALVASLEGAADKVVALIRK